MYFESLSEIFFMDGHGTYVWSAYFLSLLVILIMIWLPHASLRRSLNRLASKSKEG